MAANILPRLEPVPVFTADPADDTDEADTDLPGDENLATDTDLPGEESLATDTDLPGDENLATDTDLPGDENLATDTDLPGDADLATDTDLPAADYLCGKAEHTHDASCFGEDGELLCGLEAHVHTADCLVYPLTLAVSGDALFVYANEEPAVYRADIAGGRAPYTLQVRGEILPLIEGGNTSTVECSPTPVEAEGTVSFLYAPLSGGMHCLTATVTDAEGRAASADIRLPVSVRTNETEADWRATFAQAQLTGDPRADVIAIARTQLGYTASRTDFTVQPGGDWMHYSRYGAWYGAPYINWCAAFAGFCLVMGRVYPALYDLHGSHGIMALIVTAFCVYFSMGLTILIFVLALLWFNRYMAVAVLAGAATMIAGALLLVDDRLAMLLCIFTGIAVIVKHIPAISRLSAGK